MKKKYLNRFYKKPLNKKLEALRKAEVISTEDYEALNNKALKLPTDIANQMIENYIMNYELPFGIAMNFVIDEKEILIPMVTEEPSVIAAASNSGKIIGRSGGFQTEMKERSMIAQVALKDVSNIDTAIKNIQESEEQIIELANAAHPSILNYGGGAQRIETRFIPADKEMKTPQFLVIHLIVNTGEAMGANIVNTMAEAVAPFVADLADGSNLMNILSNYATESVAIAKCVIDPRYLSTKTMDGETVRDRIIEATQFALVDPYRAVTQNKGIMNGIDAVLLATGNDWRAVEAGAHAYATRNGQYRSLSRWAKDADGNLVGELELPISVGSVGGTLSIHPGAQFAYSLLDQPNANGLSRILVAVGLAQNLSAVRALVTEGIQKGHMGLQARSLAIRVGATGENIERVAKRLKEAKHMNSQTAKQILDEISK